MINRDVTESSIRYACYNSTIVSVRVISVAFCFYDYFEPWPPWPLRSLEAKNRKVNDTKIQL